MSAPFFWQSRIYWEDTDAGGVVYYANYLRFLERARTEWLRARGWSQSLLQAESGLVFTVVSVEAQFRRAAKLDDLLFIGCEPAIDGGASLRFTQTIRRNAPDGETVLDAVVRVACVTADGFRPRRLPPELRKELD
jgi:acyl-CoA thioester hydrolase